MNLNIYPSPHVDVGHIDQRVSISQSLVWVVDIDLSETQGNGHNITYKYSYIHVHNLGQLHYIENAYSSLLKSKSKISPIWKKRNILTDLQFCLKNKTVFNNFVKQNSF